LSIEIVFAKKLFKYFRYGGKYMQKNTGVRCLNQTYYYFNTNWSCSYV